MALGKSIGAGAKSLLDDKNKGKGKGKGKEFMNGLKEWITSPGGIVTLLLFVGAIWYIHHTTSEKKGAKA